MVSTSNFQEWKNVIRQDWKRKTWSRDPITTVALRVWNFEKLTRKVVFLFSFRKWKPPENVAKSKLGRATVGFYKRITGRLSNWRRAYQSPCWTHCVVWSWSNKKPHREQSSFDWLYTTTGRFLGYHQHRQYFSCQFFLLVPFQTDLSARKNAKIADSNHELSFHSRPIPVDTGQPFTVTWKSS